MVELCFIFKKWVLLLAGVPVYLINIYRHGLSSMTFSYSHGIHINPIKQIENARLEGVKDTFFANVLPSVISDS